MDEIDEILGNQDDSKAQETTENADTQAAETQDKVYKINGREYTAAQVEDMAKDYAELEKHAGTLASKLGEFKTKETPSKETPSEDVDLSPEELEKAKKVFKGMGVVFQEDVEKENYAKSSAAELKRISDKYGVDIDKLGKELVDLGVRIPVEKYESFWRTNHAEEFDKWRAAQISSKKPSTPYTEHPTKEGIELPSETRPQFGKNVVGMSLELIGKNGSEE